MKLMQNHAGALGDALTALCTVVSALASNFDQRTLVMMMTKINVQSYIGLNICYWTGNHMEPSVFKFMQL